MFTFNRPYVIWSQLMPLSLLFFSSFKIQKKQQWLNFFFPLMFLFQRRGKNTSVLYYKCQLKCTRIFVLNYYRLYKYWDHVSMLLIHVCLLILNFKILADKGRIWIPPLPLCHLRIASIVGAFGAVVMSELVFFLRRSSKDFGPTSCVPLWRGGKL